MSDVPVLVFFSEKAIWLPSGLTLKSHMPDGLLVICVAADGLDGSAIQMFSGALLAGAR